MKKLNDDSVAKGRVNKRSSEDVQTSPFESKKRKKEENQNTALPNSQQEVTEITNKTKKLKLKKKQRRSEKPVTTQKQKMFQKTLSLNDETNDAKDSNGSSLIKKKKNKLKKALQKTDFKEMSTMVKSPKRASHGSSNEFKVKRKKTKPIASSENLVKHNGVSDGAEEKSRKKKLNEESIDKEVSVTNDLKQVQKKKKKKAKHQEGNLSESTASYVSENLSLSKSLRKQARSKLHKKKEDNVRSIGKDNKKGTVHNPKKLDASELSKKKLKFMKFKEQKENDAKGNSIETGNSSPLKGRALKKRIINISETIAKLENFNVHQATLLLKSTSEGKQKKVQARINKIKTKIAALESELASYPTKGKITEVVKNKVFRGLPQDPPPAKKGVKPVDLKGFLQNQMKGSRFRWLNENLYNSSSEEAQGFFKEDPESFKAYHEGYSEQVAKWPVNPLDIIIWELKSSPGETVVADLGCGEAKLAAALPHLKVHSLDFIAIKPEVIACDMAHCPLLRSSVDVAVFCLSLMGTNVSDFLLEANRILKTGGRMEIAEVESRFGSMDDFINKVQHYGFQLKKKNRMDMFFFLTFTKNQDVVKSKKLPEFVLKPCVYKKR